MRSGARCPLRPPRPHHSMPVSGAIDAVLGRFVVGWAHDSDNASRRVEVELKLDGELVATATANLERGDLLIAKVGDGCHAFRIELPHGLEPGSEHVLAVRTSPEGLVLPLANDFVVEFEAGRSGPEVVVSVPDPFSAGRDSETASAAALGAPPPALLGAGGWLFELHEPELLDQLLGRRRPPEEWIAQRREQLLGRHARLQELGVRYVVAVAPDKLLLYPEQLPAELQPASSGRAAELLAAALRDDNGVELLDLLPALRDARRHGELAPRTGTGLTWTGAFHAYRALAKELAKRWPAIEPLPAKALKLGVQVPVRESLAARERFALVAGERVLITPGPDPVETEGELVSGDLRAAFVPLMRPLEELLGHGASLLEVADPAVAESAMFVHAGGGARVASLVAEHFARTLVVGSGEVPYRAVQSESVLVVVELLEESGLLTR